MNTDKSKENENDWLAEQFEQNRPHLRSVALRMLGSTAEAEDAVQEAWLKLSKADTSEVQNLGGWLTTVVARVCLDQLRSRDSRREQPLIVEEHEQIEGEPDPEHAAIMADSVGLAMMVVLDTLSPAERLAFVLHDMFAVSFEEIGPLVGRSSTAARQLASRARRRVQGKEIIGDDPERHREIVTAFLTASQQGNFAALLTALDPNAEVRTDTAAAQFGAKPARGAEAAANVFAGRAQAAQFAIIDGAPGLIWSHSGRVRVVFTFTIEGEKITAIDIIADKDAIENMDLEVQET